MKDYKISCLADVSMDQYEFTRNSRLPRGTFDSERWYRQQDAIVFCVCCVIAMLMVFGIVQ